MKKLPPSFRCSRTFCSANFLQTEHNQDPCGIVKMKDWFSDTFLKVLSSRLQGVCRLKGLRQTLMARKSMNNQ